MPTRESLDGRPAFDPEQIDSMTKALAGVPTALGLTGKRDGLTRVVASKIIELERAIPNG